NRRTVTFLVKSSRTNAHAGRPSEVGFLGTRWFARLLAPGYFCCHRVRTAFWDQQDLAPFAHSEASSPRRHRRQRKDRTAARKLGVPVRTAGHPDYGLDRKALARRLRLAAPWCLRHSLLRRDGLGFRRRVRHHVHALPHGKRNREC